MRINVLMFVISIIVSTLSVFASREALAQTNAWVPVPVQQAVRSVYKLKILGAEEFGLDRVDVTNGGGTKLKSEYMTSTTLDDQDKAVMIKQVERCESSHRDEQRHCLISHDISQSTGFIMNDGKTLWTSLRAIESNIHALEKFSGLVKDNLLKGKHPLQIFVFDSENRLVVNPYTHMVHVKILPASTEASRRSNKFSTYDNDYVGLSLSESIGRTLEKSSTPLQVGQNIFVVGYPQSQGLKIHSAQLLDINGLTRLLNLSPIALATFQVQRMVYVSGESSPAGRGGPWLNELGQVVAIQSGSRAALIDGRKTGVTRAVIPTGLPRANFQKATREPE